MLDGVKVSALKEKFEDKGRGAVRQSAALNRATAAACEPSKKKRNATINAIVA